MSSSNLNKNRANIIGILGGGQLAKMTAFEVYKLGMNLAIIENGEFSPAGDLTKLELSKSWKNKEELDIFIEKSDYITLENEFIDKDIIEYIEKFKEVNPSSKTLSKIQDKFIQKQTFSEKGIPTPFFAEINTKEDALDFGKKYNFPYLLKTRTLGYDGYGNFTVKSEFDIDLAFTKFSNDGTLRPLLAESFVSFTKELAVIVARSKNGEVLAYPCVETIQQNHICHKVVAPAPIDNEIAKKAQEIAKKCVEIIDGIGVFGIELFLSKDNELIFNEIAPRPHNSGHYTIEGCVTSQYENLIKAIMGLPLGSTEMIKNYAIMINLLGERDGSPIPSDFDKFFEYKNVKLHLYNKKSSRKGRKMGHLTIVGDDYNAINAEIEAAFDSFKW